MAKKKAATKKRNTGGKRLPVYTVYYDQYMPKVGAPAFHSKVYSMLTAARKAAKSAHATAIIHLKTRSGKEVGYLVPPPPFGEASVKALMAKKLENPRVSASKGKKTGAVKNPISPSRQGKSKWYVPYRRSRINYEDVGFYPYLLQHDVGFSGRKIYRPVLHNADGSFTLKGNYGMSRKDALAWIHRGVTIPSTAKTENPKRKTARKRSSSRRTSKRNSAAAADQMFHTFHGTAPTQTLEITEELHVHGHLAALGDLHEIKILSPAGKVALDFRAPYPVLSCDEKGRQLFIVGGDQQVNLAALGITGNMWKESLVLGVIFELTYETRKTMHGQKLISYYHKLGEDTLRSMGKRSPHLFIHPVLLYDSINRKLSIAGGTYKITAAGIED